MYEEYSRQALPSKKYRELLGSAICVFNSNNQFIIESILRIDNSRYDWYKLTDKESGHLHEPIADTIAKNSDSEIASLFKDLVNIRNRIIHSFQVTENGEQILRTKRHGRDPYEPNKQYNITEEYLLDFIKANETLSTMLDTFRNHNSKD